jgi:bacterioferritin (cytochrome b1)
MNDHAFWPGTKMLRTVVRNSGAADPPVSTIERNKTTTIDLLNRALTIARTGAARCERQYLAALRNHSPTLAAVALEHANEAQVHAGKISERIVNLGRKPDASSDPANRGSQPSQGAANSLATMISQHLAAGRATINSYRQIAALFDPFDPPSKKLIDDIVCAEEACVSQLASLLDESSTAKKEA